MLEVSIEKHLRLIIRSAIPNSIASDNDEFVVTCPFTKFDFWSDDNFLFILRPAFVRFKVEITHGSRKTHAFVNSTFFINFTACLQNSLLLSGKVRLVIC
jgi:hypothetical protein